ncbi:MAG: 2OG-Fe(II) oxygenase family protein, partial [Candidatus Poseidoniaceae archaeon]
TLLVGSSADGLEVLDMEGDWIPVKAHSQHLTVNVGDMLQNLTNGLFKSTTHRVVNPPDAATERYSMPMFVHPRGDVDLTPRQKFVDMTGGEPHYPSILADEYLHQRLVEIGLAS